MVNYYVTAQALRFISENGRGWKVCKYTERFTYLGKLGGLVLGSSQFLLLPQLPLKLILPSKVVKSVK